MSGLSVSLFRYAMSVVVPGLFALLCMSAIFVPMPRLLTPSSTSAISIVVPGYHVLVTRHTNHMTLVRD